MEQLNETCHLNQFIPGDNSPRDYHFRHLFMPVREVATLASVLKIAYVPRLMKQIDQFVRSVVRCVCIRKGPLPVEAIRAAGLKGEGKAHVPLGEWM